MAEPPFAGSYGLRANIGLHGWLPSLQLYDETKRPEAPGGRRRSRWAGPGRARRGRTRSREALGPPGRSPTTSWTPWTLDPPPRTTPAGADGLFHGTGQAGR